VPGLWLFFLSGNKYVRNKFALNVGVRHGIVLALKKCMNYNISNLGY
jgi:hypothetical protein